MYKEKISNNGQNATKSRSCIKKTHLYFMDCSVADGDSGYKDSNFKPRGMRASFAKR